MGTRAQQHTGSCCENQTMASILRLAARRMAAPATFRSAHPPLLNSPNAYSMQSLHHWQQTPRMLYTSLATAATSHHSNMNSASMPPAYLEGLNAEQLEAVVGPIQSTRVVAGPGSGKVRRTSTIRHLTHSL